jgi:hypothetical protein
MEHKHVLRMGSDRMFLRYAYHKPFMVKFPDKCEWQNRFNPARGHVLVQKGKDV